ncbi:hypothetical protein ACFFP0_24735 [Rhizobium puerariae]|uniref:NYN domain-containing protein n=1 Tax=Rhizobium puerariae TaxID=1585791 RepID=A0ABV6AN70_9HYPH
MSLDVSAYPACANKLRYQRADLTDPLMNHFWAAVCVATEYRDAELAEFGGFDFNDRSPENGRIQLGRLEQFIAARGNAPRRQKTVQRAAHDGVQAMLGARGIKTSMLVTDADFWTAAETLFPGCIKRKGGLDKLHKQMIAIPKKQRHALANENLHRLPADWISKAANHQAKLGVVQ